jgi:hypothetical protein
MKPLDASRKGTAQSPETKIRPQLEWGGAFRVPEDLDG